MSIKGIPKGVHDIWEKTGSKPEFQYTWDCTLNTNLKWDSFIPKPKTRFDRLYYRPAQSPSATFEPCSFQLVGLNKLKSCNQFCSDHWGILADCKLTPENLNK